MIKGFDAILSTVCDAESSELAKIYFEKYWLNENEFIEKWLKILESIFDITVKHLPDMMFRKNFELFPLVGGDIFTIEKDFTSLLDCISQTGDSHFVIIQNKNVPINGWHFTKFKYPVDISWKELMSGGIVGSEHLNNGCKDYFVFGDSGNWGRYVANSWIQPTNVTGLNPLNIMGFKKEYSEVFEKNFQPLRLLEPEITSEILISEWLPDSYKK